MQDDSIKTSEQNNTKWDKLYKEIEQYYCENGNLLVPVSCVYNNVKLGQCINYLRTRYKKGLLSDERVAKLNAIGMAWDAREAEWNETYQIAKQYYKANGDLSVSLNCVYKGIRLGIWIGTQRKAYKKGVMPEDRYARLSAIGMTWNELSTRWSKAYQIAEQYYRENGNLVLLEKDTYNGIDLGKWIFTQRTAYKNGTLSEEQIDLLNNIGMVWDTQGCYAKWNKAYLTAKRYYRKNGNLLVPCKYVTNGINLGPWIGTQRNAYKKGVLSAERIAKLNDIGMVWRISRQDTGVKRGEAQWNKMYRVAEQYYNANGELIVPATYVSNGINLGAWISRMRHAYKTGNLSEARIAMLNAIGMAWNAWDVKWYKAYHAAKQYYQMNNDLQIPQKWHTNGINLGTWIRTQRNAYKSGTLPADRIAMLNAIGMAWDPLEAQWNENYSVAEQYYLENGNLLVPTTTVYNGVKLGGWINCQRQDYKQHMLSEERIAMLNAIGMEW